MNLFHPWTLISFLMHLYLFHHFFIIFLTGNSVLGRTIVFPLWLLLFTSATLSLFEAILSPIFSFSQLNTSALLPLHPAPRKNSFSHWIYPQGCASAPSTPYFSWEDLRLFSSLPLSLTKVPLYFTDAWGWSFQVLPPWLPTAPQHFWLIVNFKPLIWLFQRHSSASSPSLRLPGTSSPAFP